MLIHKKIRVAASKFLAVMLATLFLVSCSTASPTTTVPASTQTTAIEETATETLAPSPSPTTARLEAVLLAPKGADEYQVELLKTAIASLALDSDLDFKTTATMTAADIDASTRVVVVLPPDPGLADLIKAAPQTQFVAIGFENLQPANNLSVIGPQGFRPDQQAFMAGYIAAILTNDFRTGIITQAGVDNSTIQNAFTNGVRYFCGLCRPAFPPYVVYPQAAEIATDGGWQAAADTLLQDAVSTIYITPGSSSAELLNYLVESGANLIGGQTPPDALLSEWIATIMPDPSSGMSQIWPDLMAGKGGDIVPMPLRLANIDSALLNPARQRLVDATLNDLVNGYIEAGTIAEP